MQILIITGLRCDQNFTHQKINMIELELEFADGFEAGLRSIRLLSGVFWRIGFVDRFD